MADPTSKVKHPEFAARLKTGMKKEGVRQKDIAIELKVTVETVRLYMRGERMPRDAKMRKLSKMIGVSVAELRFGKNPGDQPVMPLMKGEHVTNEDELAMLKAYRGIKKEWARESLRRRAVELLEEFGEPGTANPWGKANTQ